MKTRPLVYPGALGEPVYINPAAWPHSIEDLTHSGSRTRGEPPALITKAQQAYRNKIREVIGEKYGDLFAYYGISMDAPDAWRGLALALVGQHVPGFGGTKVRPQPRPDSADPKGPGRPRDRTVASDVAFCDAVEGARQAIAAKRNVPASAVKTIDAIRKIKKDNPAKWRASLRTLENRYPDSFYRASLYRKGGIVRVLMSPPRRKSGKIRK